MPSKPPPFGDFSFRVNSAADMDKLRAHMEDALRADSAARAAPPPQMVDLNQRPKPAPPPKANTVQLVRSGGPAAGRGLFVLVPTSLGRLEPVLDGETGLPADFMREFGDPRAWGRDRSGEIHEIAKRAAKMCQKLFTGRTAA